MEGKNIEVQEYDRLRLVADNPRSYEWESYPRREPKPPRERLGPLRPRPAPIPSLYLLRFRWWRR
jgi:hypothetical protein